MRRGWSVALIVLATMLLLITSIGFWLRTSVLNERAFVELTTESLTVEHVRQAISESVVDRTLADRPVLLNLVRERASEVVAGLLGTSIVEGGLERTAALAFNFVVHNEGERVAINLVPVKGLIASSLSILSPSGESAIDGDRIPDEIIILQEGDLPNFSMYFVLIEWITLLSGIGTVALLVLVTVKSWSTGGRNGAIKWFGASLATGAAILALATWTVGSTAVQSINSQVGRVVVEEVYANIIAQLRVQSFGLVIAGIGIWFLGWWMQRDAGHSNPVATGHVYDSVAPAGSGQVGEHA